MSFKSYSVCIEKIHSFLIPRSLTPLSSLIVTSLLKSLKSQALHRSVFNDLQPSHLLRQRSGTQHIIPIMNFLNLLNLVLGLALTSVALTQGHDVKSNGFARSHPARHTPEKRATDIAISDFLISDIYSHTFLDSTEMAWNRSLSCKLLHLFISQDDPNVSSPLHRSKLEHQYHLHRLLVSDNCYQQRTLCLCRL
jgi:hypothetical protein